jgi:hypothetical protein
MKKLLALLLLFGIVGCATVYDSDLTGWSISEKKLPTVNGQVQKYMYRNFGYKVNKQTNEIEIKTDGIYRYDKQYQACTGVMFICLNGNLLPSLVNDICLSSFSTPLESIEEGKRIKFPIQSKIAEIYEFPTIFKAKCWNEVDYKLKQTEIQKYWEEQRIASEKIKQEVLLKKLEKRKSTCREYGFKDNTDGMGLCLIELDKLDAIKNQATAANLAQSNLIAQQQTEAKKQREAQALINLGALISGAGVQNPTKPEPITPSYSESYTSSRTVPSNQNCPLLNVPLKKQEVKNGNRVCYY